jgi:hypothetical protein
MAQKMKRKATWYQVLAQARTKKAYPIVIAGHCLVDKMIPSNIEVSDVEAAVRSAPIVTEKCELPDKLVFRSVSKESGKRPLVVVTRFRQSHIKVVTVYLED